MYKQVKNPNTGNTASMILLFPSAYIPFDPANTDYQRFKSDIESGVELQSPEGTPMSPESAIAFVKELP